MDFRIGQRVQANGKAAHIGSVRYIGSLEGYDGLWIGVDWDDGQGRHDGTVNGVHYFDTAGKTSGSLVRAQNLSAGTTLLDALVARYKTSMNKSDSEEMFLMSVRQRKVTVELVGQSKIEEKQKHLEELTAASLLFAQVSSAGPSGELAAAIPNMRELDLTGNLIADWNFVVQLCQELPLLRALDLSSNRFTVGSGPFPRLVLTTLVLNNCGISWQEVEVLKGSLPELEELHLRQNNISIIQSTGSVEGFERLHTINLEDNNIAEWDEVAKLSRLKSLKHLNLNKNAIAHVKYPEGSAGNPFQQLVTLLLGKNKIEDWNTVNALDMFPALSDVRLTDNPLTDTAKGGAPRYILVARLSKITILNGSEVKIRERKDSEIRYVRYVLNTMADCKPDQMRILHPRFEYLKTLYDIGNETATTAAGPAAQSMAASLLSITLKCVAASVGELPPVTKKYPGSITVGKLKLLCEGLFKLKASKQRLFLEDKESPLPMALDDDLESLASLGVNQSGVVLVEEQD